MFWRTLALSIAFWGVLSAQAADLSELPPDQQQTAKCMLSVVSGAQGVTDSKLRLSAVPNTIPSSKGPFRTFVDYTYRHRSHGVSPRVSHQQIEITEIIATRKGSFALGGITSESAPDLNDNDSGMLQITHEWTTKCGLALSVVTV